MKPLFAVLAALGVAFLGAVVLFVLWFKPVARPDHELSAALVGLTPGPQTRIPGTPMRRPR